MQYQELTCTPPDYDFCELCGKELKAKSLDVCRKCGNNEEDAIEEVELEVVSFIEDGATTEEVNDLIDYYREKIHHNYECVFNEKVDVYYTRKQVI